jgi:hypothetical protein
MLNVRFTTPETASGSGCLEGHGVSVLSPDSGLYLAPWVLTRVVGSLLLS